MRSLCRWVVWAGIALWPACPVLASNLPDGVEQVGPATYLFTSNDQRSLFLVGDDGVIVTDPQNAAAAARYRAAIRALTPLPVRYVVYSHNHWDRIAGAETFRAEGARIVAQERCAGALRVNGSPAVLLPDVTFGSRYAVRVKGASLGLRYFGPAHGDCLTVFHAQPANLLQVVDLVPLAQAALPKDPLVPNLRPHNLRQFFAAVNDYAAGQGIVGVIASEASGPALGKATVVGDQKHFWDLVYETVEAAEARGAVGNDSIPRLRPDDHAPFRSFAGYDPAALPLIMRRIVAYEAMGR